MDKNDDQVCALLRQFKLELDYCHKDLQSKIKAISTSNIQDIISLSNVAAKTAE